jgi:putative membrane protein
VTVTTLLAQWNDGGHMMDGNGTGWLWILPMLVIVLAVIAVVVLVARPSNPRAEPPAATPDPNARAREILAERLAKGEIAVEEYQERLAALR